MYASSIPLGINAILPKSAVIETKTSFSINLLLLPSTFSERFTLWIESFLRMILSLVKSVIRINLEPISL